MTYNKRRTGNLNVTGSCPPAVTKHNYTLCGVGLQPK